MDKFETIRQSAAELHLEVAGAGADAIDSLAFAEATAKHLKIECNRLPPADPLLKGARALFDSQGGMILCDSTASPTEQALLIAHEIGHAQLHSISPACGAGEIGDLSQSAEQALVGKQRAQSYGARERRELQANVFARELLLPKTLAWRLYVEDQKTSVQVAEQMGLPVNCVRQQLFDSLLLPSISEPEQAVTANSSQPDSSQKRAIDHRGTPFLLQAGPGTGKTKTLVWRVQSLLAEGVDPDSILILTFSNRAANELVERLAATTPDAASRIWAGTFHSFGLDLLRRHHNRLGLPPDPPLYDKGDAIEMLEDIFPTLPLEHYRNLWDPILVLRDILEAISRAKDELVDSAQYRKLAKQMRAEGTEEADIRAAEKSMEVAEIYAQYERELLIREAVDFGDLVMRPALLLESNQDIREEVRLRHRHVLVDEYQDVNRASARLLKTIAGDGERLWVVGDTRQSIYRFRGASSSNMAKFSKQDYPNAEVDRLEINYRSSQQVVDSLNSVAQEMDVSKSMELLDLSSAHGKGAEKPDIRRHETLGDEAAGIASCVRDMEQEGIPLRDQAVLCRSNRQLSDIATALEKRGIPVLHLGSLFERDEVRDLLALLSLATSQSGDDLVRICAMPRYSLSLQDTHTAIQHIHKETRPILDILPELPELSDLSKESAAGFKRLARDFSGIPGDSTPWELLSEYLLDRTGLARQMATESSTSARTRSVAVWQFLNFIRTPGPARNGPAILNTLERIRQLVFLREDRDLRQVPAAALHMNAVRLMTIHASKGLEFEVVHIPGLTNGSLPKGYRGSKCPPPIGLIEGTKENSSLIKEQHKNEEECLFFVALSRARAHLHLYLAQKRTSGKKYTESRFVSWLLPDLANRIEHPETLPLPDGLSSTLVEVSFPKDWRLTDKHLIEYEKCPRRFFYTHVLGLERARKTTVFTQTHDCVYKLLRWLEEKRHEANPSLDKAEKRFEAIWKKYGPVDHAFAAKYREIASRLIETAVTSGNDRHFLPTESIKIDLTGAPVWVKPDEMLKLDDGTIVLRRLRTGKKRSDEYGRLEYALYLMATTTKFSAMAKVQALHLTDAANDDVSLTAQKLQNRRKTLETETVHLANQEFPPKPDDTVCPRCPHFFVCGRLPSGSLRLS